MVYKRYIKRGGKLYGPYYYRTYRGKNGNVISEYLPNYKPSKLSGVNKNILLLTTGLIFMFLLSFFIVNNIILDSNSKNINSNTELIPKITNSFHNSISKLIGLVISEELENIEVPIDSQEQISEQDFSEEIISEPSITENSEKEIEPKSEKSETELLSNEVSDEFNSQNPQNQQQNINKEINIENFYNNSQKQTQKIINQTENNEIININNKTNEDNQTKSNNYQEIIENNLIEQENNQNKIEEQENNLSTEKNVEQLNIINETQENNFLITEEKINETENTIEITKKQQIVIGKPVKWIKKIEIKNNSENIIIKLPKQAKNISIKTGEEIEKALNDLETEEIQIIGITGAVILNKNSNNFKKLLNWFKYLKITGNVIQESEIQNEIIETQDSKEININEIIEITQEQEIAIEYYTEAPQSFEQETEKGKKIIISGPDELNYQDILAYTEINEIPSDSIHLFHMVEESREEVEIDKYDLNNNGLIDYIEWDIPHLSEQEYELEIIVLNIQSYPTVGGNWIVEFTTYGKADLIIRSINETTWSNENEENDLKFLEIKCGDQILDYQWIDNSVFIENYECNDVGSETSKVLTEGEHNLEFDFGGIKAYAHNWAYINQTDGFSTAVLGATQPRGIIFNGSDFWIVDYSDAFAYHTDSQGNNITDGFSTDTIGSGAPFGIATNGSDFWITDTSDFFVYHVDSQGNNITDGFSTTGLSSYTPRGITTNGSDFWIIDSDDDFVYHTNLSGSNLTGGFPTDVLGSGSPAGITNNGSDFWITDGNSDFVYHTDSQGNNITDGFSTSILNSNTPIGILINGSNLWITDQINAFAYHVLRYQDQLTACGTLDTENGIYILQNNVSTTSTCFTLTANNITLDLNGYHIDGDRTNLISDMGILVDGYNYTTIKNGFINDTTYGIHFTDSFNNTVNNITSNNHTQNGIRLTSSSGNTLTNITVNGNLGQGGGIYLASSNNNTLKNITSSWNVKGISLATSLNNTLIKIFTNHTTVAINFESASNLNTAYNLSIFEYADAVYFTSSASNNLIDNLNASTTQTGADGIFISSSSNNTITRSHIVGGMNGIEIASHGALAVSSHNLFKDISVTGTASSNIIFDTNAAGSGIINNTFLNATYSTTSYTNHTTGGDIEEIRKWYYKSHVRDLNTGSSINAVNVTGFNQTENYAFNLTTDSNGLTEIFNIIDYVVYVSSTGTTTNYYSPYTIYAVESSYPTRAFTYNATLNENNLSHNMSLDNIFPDINITFPENYTNSSNTGLHVNYTASDNYISSCWYSNDSYSINTTLADCGTNLTTIIWAEGLHNITIWVNDTAGNENSSSISFTINITQVTDCGTLNRTNATYTLQNNITTTGDCFTIKANNITLDFSGYNITGDDGSGDHGINIAAYNYTTMKNGHIYDFNDGIYLSQSLNNTITNITINSSSDDGIDLVSSSSYNVLTEIITTSNTDKGISLSSADNNNLTNIIANSNSDNGVDLSNSDNNVLINITANSNSDFGVDLGSSDNNVLINITASSNDDYGFYITSSSNNNFTNITTNSNPGTAGFAFFTSGENNTINNIVSNSNPIGIFLSTGMRSNTFQNFEVWNSTSGVWPGITLNGVSNNTFIDGFVNQSNIYGIGVVSAGAHAGGNLFKNMWINNSGTYDVILYAAASGVIPNTTIINVSYDPDSISFTDAGAAGDMELFKKWYFDVNVDGEDGSDLPGVSMDLVNRTNNNIFSKTTNTTGQIERQELVEYHALGTSFNPVYNTLHNITLSKNGFHSITNNFNISYMQNILYNVKMIPTGGGGESSSPPSPPPPPPPPPEEPPEDPEDPIEPLPCVPDCSGKECGDSDGCDGTCSGSCPAGESCESGVCVLGCEDECSSGQPQEKTCSGNTLIVETCTDQNGDGCTELVEEEETCTFGCNEGSCIGECSDNCATEVKNCGTWTFCEGTPYEKTESCGDCLLSCEAGVCICHEDWICEEEGPCVKEGDEYYSYRDCFDNNECGSKINKPITKISCEYDEETDELIPITPVSGGDGLDGVVCVPKLKCGEWSECESSFSLEDVINEKTDISGRQTRICRDLEECKNDVIETKECKTKKDVTTKRIEECSTEYLEVYDNQGELISKLELIQGKYKKLNVQLSLTKQDYCPYCFDGIKNYDEDETDCNIQGTNCPICKTKIAKVSKKNWIMLILFLLLNILLLILLILYIILSRKNKKKLIDFKKLKLKKDISKKPLKRKSRKKLKKLFILGFIIKLKKKIFSKSNNFKRKIKCKREKAKQKAIIKKRVASYKKRKRQEAIARFFARLKRKRRYRKEKAKQKAIIKKRVASYKKRKRQEAIAGFFTRIKRRIKYRKTKYSKEIPHEFNKFNKKVKNIFTTPEKPGILEEKALINDYEKIHNIFIKGIKSDFEKVTAKPREIQKKIKIPLIIKILEKFINKSSKIILKIKQRKLIKKSVKDDKEIIKKDYEKIKDILEKGLESDINKSKNLKDNIIKSTSPRKSKKFNFLNKLKNIKINISRIFIKLKRKFPKFKKRKTNIKKKNLNNLKMILAKGIKSDLEKSKYKK